ncbi:MAG: hypothetical protein WCL51_17965, partial [Bacteroidota bacterium]
MSIYRNLGIISTTVEGIKTCGAYTSPKSYYINTIFHLANPFAAIKNTIVTPVRTSVTSVSTAVTSAHTAVTFV